MLQVETLVSACAGGYSDRKIACETLAGDHTTDPPEPHPDSPPESFWLSRDEEIDWWSRNAVYERKESTKANSSTNLNLNPNSGTNSNNNSQRFALNFKSKPSTIIGLPKPQKTSFADAKNRRNHKPSNIRLFPKSGVSVGKSESDLVEPSSPKVSCMGRVRSKRDRNRKLRGSSDMDTNEKHHRNENKPDFFGSLRSIFCFGRRVKPDRKPEPRAEDSNIETKNVAVNQLRARDSTSSVKDASWEESISRKSVSESEPPGLGAMMRFASGRRSESWGAGDSEPHVAQ